MSVIKKYDKVKTNRSLKHGVLEKNGVDRHENPEGKSLQTDRQTDRQTDSDVSLYFLNWFLKILDYQTPERSFRDASNFYIEGILNQISKGVFYLLEDG